MELLPGLFHLIFQGWGARARISVLPLLFAGKSREVLCFSWGVTFFENGTRYSDFWSWCASQFIFGKFDILDI